MKKKTTEEFIKESINTHGYKYEYDNVIYVNNLSKVKIRCKKHGIFEQSPIKHIKGSNCPKCAKISTSIKMKENYKNGVIGGWCINSDIDRRSYPEKFFLKVFENNEIFNRYTIKEKFSYGRYFIDFLVVEIKLIIEIDGSQHYRTKEAIEYDRIRDEYFLNEGFKVYRIKWSDVCNNAVSEIYELIKFIGNIENETIRKYNIDECLYIKKRSKNTNRKKEKKCDNCEKLIFKENNLCRSCWILSQTVIKEKNKVRKNKCVTCGRSSYGKYCSKCYSESRRVVERPMYEELLIDVYELGYSATGRKYGVCDKTIKKWIKYGSLV